MHLVKLPGLDRNCYYTKKADCNNSEVIVGFANIVDE